MNHKEQSLLFEKYKECDVYSIYKIIDCNHEILVRCAKKILGSNIFLEEDIVSQVAENFYNRDIRSKSKLNPKGRIVDYIRKSVKNASIKKIKEVLKENTAVEKRQVEVFSIQYDENSYTRILNNEDTINGIIRIIKLKGRPKEFLEFFMKDVNDEDIARELQVKKELIRKWRNRAIQKIRDNSKEIINYLNELDDEY